MFLQQNSNLPLDLKFAVRVFIWSYFLEIFNFWSNVENQEVSMLFRETKLNWLHAIMVLLSPEWLSHLWIRNIYWLPSAAPFLCYFFFFLMLELSTRSLQFLPCFWILPLHIFGQEPATEWLRQKAKLWNGMRGIIHESASCLCQQLLYCYSNKLPILSHVKDFAQPEAAFGLVGTRGGNWKSLKSRCHCFSSQLQQPQLLVALQWVWWQVFTAW